MDVYLHPEGFTAQGLVNLSEFLAANALPTTDFAQASRACLVAVDERMQNGRPPRWTLPAQWARHPDSNASVFSLSDEDLILVPDETPALGLSEHEMLQHMNAECQSSGKN